MEDKDRNRALEKASYPDKEPKWYKWSITVSLIIIGLGALLLIWSAYSDADDVEQESEEVSWGAPRDIPYENSDISIRVVS